MGWSQDKLDVVRNYLGTHNTKACIVLKDGKTAAEWFFGSFTRDSVHYWVLAGKTILGLLVGVAQEEGLLSINETTSRFLETGWTSEISTKERLIKIKNNLSMTTGLDKVYCPTIYVIAADYAARLSEAPVKKPSYLAVITGVNFISKIISTVGQHLSLQE